MNRVIKLCIVILLFGMTVNTEGQIKIDLKKKVENAVNRRANQRTDQAINKGLDAVENAVKEDLKNNGNQQADTQKPQDAQSSAGKSNSDQGGQSAGQQQEGLKAFSKYDFVPGDKIILYEDFSQDAVGDFPALWTTDAAGEINSLNIATGNWLNLNSGEGTYWFMKDIEFPQNFILEMDIVPKTGGMRIAAVLVLFGEDSHSEMNKENYPGTGGIHISMEKGNWITRGYRKGSNEYLSGSSQVNTVEAEKVNHVIIWVQNRRVRIYNKGAKVLDVPTNLYEGTKFKRLCFKLYRGASSGSYISNIKITTAAPDTRSKLLTEGKLITYGIYFDVNKDVVKPESYGTLKDIATVLTENPDVKVQIVGHTDSDGNDIANLELSKKRSAAVKNELVKTFGLDASRFDTSGMGEDNPVAPNDTPSNKALNRRVEFIKM